MRTIWKYPLQVTDEQGVHMPRGAKAMLVGFQGDELCMWVMVDPMQLRETRTIRIYGTGHNIPYSDRANMDYVGTAIDPVNPFVWHVFIKEAQ